MPEEYAECIWGANTSGHIRCIDYNCQHQNSSICLSICLSAHLSVRPSVCLSLSCSPSLLWSKIEKEREKNKHIWIYGWRFRCMTTLLGIWYISSQESEGKASTWLADLSKPQTSGGSRCDSCQPQLPAWDGWVPYCSLQAMSCRQESKRNDGYRSTRIVFLSLFSVCIVSCY